jgi:hypothetical protein
MTNGQIAFADLNNVYMLAVDLRAPAVSVTEGSFLVPGGSSDLLWIIGRNVGWVAPFDTNSGVVSERVDVSDVIGWPEVGVAEGLIVRPIDESTYGRVAYWTPSLGLQPIELPDPESRLVTASGNIAVFASDDGAIDVLDLANNNRIAQFSMDLGEDSIINGCLSPERTTAVFMASSGDHLVVDLRDGNVIYSDPTIEPYETIGWISADQILVITGAEGDRTLQSIEPFNGSVNSIARLRGPGSWWITTGSTDC